MLENGIVNLIAVVGFLILAISIVPAVLYFGTLLPGSGVPDSGVPDLAGPEPDGSESGPEGKSTSRS